MSVDGVLAILLWLVCFPIPTDVSSVALWFVAHDPARDEQLLTTHSTVAF